MHTFVKPENFRSLKGPIVLAAGFFDGVHAGHRRVLGTAVQQAKAIGGQAWALTFDRHPKSLLSPDSAPALITQLPMRLERLAAEGLDGTLLLEFTRELASLSPEEFVRWVCADCNVAEIHCGENWRFGAKASGTPGELKELGKKYGFTVSVAESAFYNGQPVSSTRIRKSIAEGDLTGANTMLCHPYTIRETVVKGRQVARTYGIATANFSPNADLMPPVGVYAVESTIGDRRLLGLGSLGFRPTFEDARPEKPVLEVHFLDFSGDLYGATLDISFLSFIRHERKFASGDELFAQVRDDIEKVKTSSLPICN